MKLKPCPRKVCGGEAKLIQELIEVDHGRHHYLRSRVVCLKCSMLGPWGNDSGIEGEVIAADAWNGEWGRE